jgi:hypothetical protein
VIPDGNDPHLGNLLDIVTLMQHSGRERTEAMFVARLKECRAKADVDHALHRPPTSLQQNRSTLPPLALWSSVLGGLLIGNQF